MFKKLDLATKKINQQKIIYSMANVNAVLVSSQQLKMNFFPPWKPQIFPRD